MPTYLRLLRYVKPYMPRLVAAIVCMILAAAANLYVPWVIKDVIDKVLAAKDMAMLHFITISIIVVFIFRGIFFYTQNYLMSYIGQRVIIDIREALFSHLQRLSISFYDKRQTGTVMSYITNDVAAVQGAMVESVIEAVTELTTLIGSLGAMFFIHWKLTLLTLVTMPAVAHAMRLFGRKLKRASNVVQERSADITSVLQETISSIRVIQSFAREDYELGRFKHQNFQNFRAQMKSAQLMATLTPAIELIAAFGVTAIIWYGGTEVIDDVITPGALIAFLVYAVNLANPIKRLSRVYGNIQRALAAAERFFEVMDIQSEVKDEPGAEPLSVVKGKVRFDHVTFEYKPGESVLSDVSFEAQPGQLTAIVGPSGAGKTTIASLLMRFYDPQAGSVQIDDINIKTATLSSLRNQIGVVPQETVLFNGSVYENILYGRLDATSDEVIAAAKVANAHTFISQMPEGYDTPIGERGAKLSGGQRQRIAIARAVLKNPRILVLDEATSALDTESEKLVQEALDKLMIGRTSFVIAHRLSTIQRADTILVMEKGRITEQGKHSELIAKGGLYSKLYTTQFGSRE